MDPAASGSRIRCSGSATDGRWYWRGMFELHAAAAGVAGLRQPRRGDGVRALARRAAADRSRVPARGVRHARRGRARATRGASAAPTPTHGVFDFTSWDPEPAGSHPAGRERLGRRRSRRQRLGVDLARCSRRFPGSRRCASYPEYSADFFDGEHFVMKGASPATARELLRPTSATGSGRAIRTSTRRSAACRTAG